MHQRFAPAAFDIVISAIHNRRGHVKEMRAVLEKWVADLTADKVNARRIITASGLQDAA